MNKYAKRIAAIWLFFLLFPTTVDANIRLPQLVSDGMVLQRDMKIKIWGWAEPGEKVSVSFNGKKESTVTNASGKWLVFLPAMKAGGPFSMTIRGADLITLSDILIGDVWFCSGQSNMVLPMERVKEKYPDEIANANYPQIRNFFVPTLADVTNIHDDLPKGNWVAADPKNVLGFGAASYFFAKDIYLKYHIPIGIINASVGGTPIEAWISEAGFSKFPQYETQIKNFRDTGFMNSQNRKGLVSSGNRNGVIGAVPEPDKGISGPLPWYAIDYIPEGWHGF
jgi:sialate O-acetylesterase